MANPPLKVKTGIKGLDAMLGGGLIQHRPYIVSGPPGAGKTTLAMQFLLEGLAHNENVLFVAVDEPPNEIKQNFSEFKWDLSGIRILDANSDIRRLEPTPVLDITSKSMVQYFSEVGETIRKTPDFESVIVTIHSLQQTVKKLVEREHYQRIAIDSMSGVKYFCMEGLDESMSVQSFMRFLAELKTTTLLTLETDEGFHLTPELFLSRGEIRLHKWWAHGRMHRGLSVEIVRGSRHDEALRPMVITDTGICAYPQVSQWRRKTSKGKGANDEEARRIRAQLQEILKNIDIFAAETQGAVSVDDVKAQVDSAQAHLKKKDLYLAAELADCCAVAYENKIAAKDSITKILSVETLISDCKVIQVDTNDFEARVAKAKECVNAGRFRDALKIAKECEASLQAHLTGTPEQPPAQQTSLDAAEPAQPAAQPQAAEPPAQKAPEAPPVAQQESPKPAPLPSAAPAQTAPPTQPPPAVPPPQAATPAAPAPVPKATHHEAKPTPHAVHKPAEHGPPAPAPKPAGTDVVSRTTPSALYGQQAAPPQDGAKYCPACSSPLKFIHLYNRWYCYKCKKYAPKDF